MPANSPARELPPGAGFAGLRVQESRDGPLDWRKNDWVAFLGAAYFRAIGELRQYGLSARGVALDVAVADRPEEFPDFTQFYIDAAPDGQTLTLYALMEGPSIVGAYRFLMTRGKGVVMDIDRSSTCARRCPASASRRRPRCTGIRKRRRTEAIDWRPEVHDSDGLEMWSGNGERLWRALNNPPRIMVSVVPRRQPARLRPHAARPRVRPLSRRRLLRPAAEPVGRAAAGPGWPGLGQGVDPALRDPDRRRDPRQRGGDVGAGPAGAGGGRAAPQLPPLLARQFPFPVEARHRGRDPARARGPARPAAAEGRAEIHGRVSRRPAGGPSLWREARARRHRPRAEPSAPTS